MARIRTIKPGFFRSEDVAPLTFRARLTWIGLWTQCDDHGRTKDSAPLIKGDIWPLDDVSLDDIEDDLDALSLHGRIVRYTVADRALLAVVNWHVHQVISRPSKTNLLPAPPVAVGPTDPADLNYCLTCAGVPPDNPPQNTHGTLTEPSLSPHGALSQGREGKGSGSGGERASAGARTERSLRLAPEDQDQEPPRKCPTHRKTHSNAPCGACGDARRAHDSWVKAQKPKPTPNITIMCQDHPDQPAGRCVPCESLAVPSPLKRTRTMPREAS